MPAPMIRPILRGLADKEACDQRVIGYSLYKRCPKGADSVQWALFPKMLRIERVQNRIWAGAKLNPFVYTAVLPKACANNHKIVQHNHAMNGSYHTMHLKFIYHQTIERKVILRSIDI